MKQRRSPIHLPRNGFIDFIGFLADDLDLRLSLADDKNFIQYNGVGHDKKNSVQNGLFVTEQCLTDQDQKVKYIEHYRNRQSEFFVQDQRRDIHASGRSSAPYDDSQ